MARSLRAIGFNPKRAFDIAMGSVVVENGRKVLPYGFRQSPVLATVAFEYSYLGSALKDLAEAGLLVSVYVDDVLISGEFKDVLEEASETILKAAHLSGFPLSAEKCAIAAARVNSFNCHIEKSKISVLEERMEEFVNDHHSKGEAGQKAIMKYIAAVSSDELIRFQAMM